MLILKMVQFAGFKGGVIFWLFLLLSSMGKAQEVRVIDNKGTIRVINKVTMGANKPNSQKRVRGDVWFDKYPSPTSVQIFDGTEWKSININGVIKYNDKLTATKNQIGTLVNGTTSTSVYETVTKVEQPKPSGISKPDGVGHINYYNEAGNKATVQIVSKNPSNLLKVGTDGGGVRVFF